MYVYTHVYIHVCICVCIYIYIYIGREREREMFRRAQLRTAGMLHAAPVPIREFTKGGFSKGGFSNVCVSLAQV